MGNSNKKCIEHKQTMSAAVKLESNNETKETMDIKTRQKYLVFGYIRVLKVNAATDIYNMVLLYYVEYDYFYKTGVCSNIDENIMDTYKVTNGYIGYQTCYGYQTISFKNNYTNTYCWEFKIISKGENIVIGLDDAECKWFETTFHLHPETVNYGYCCHGRMYSSTERYKMGYKNYGEPFHENDIIKMELDMTTGSLTYFRNNVCYGIAYKIKKNVEYKMAVSLFGDGACVILKR